MPEVSYEGFMKFVAFLYTDKLEILGEKLGSSSTSKHLSCARIIIELMSLSDRFKVDKLKSLVEHYAKKSLSIESVAAMLNTSYEMQDSCLKNHCFDYVMKHFGEVIGTPAFSELPPSVLREVLGAASKLGATVKDNQTT